jgi:hypothetical protein
MQIELELEEIHTNRRLALQQRLNKPLAEVVAVLLSKAVDEYSTETEGLKMLKIMDKHGILGCMEGNGRLSVEYKKHLWSQG